MKPKGKPLPNEEIFTRSVFGFILIGAFFIPGGRWAALILGILFLISAYQGICVTCLIYKKFIAKNDANSSK